MLLVRHALNFAYFFKKSVSSLKQNYLSTWNTFPNLRNTWLLQDDHKWKVLSSLIHGKSDKSDDAFNLYLHRGKFILKKNLIEDHSLYANVPDSILNYLKKNPKVQSKRNILINYRLAINKIR